VTPGRPGRKALLVDLDGTVRETKTGRPHPIKPWDQRVKAGVKEKLTEYKAGGYVVVGVTNQGGVAYNLLTEEDVKAANTHLANRLLPDLFDLILYCPYHPRGRVEAYRKDADCRKPRPGMAFEARDRLGLTLTDSIMVGDMDTDQEFARNAGIGRFYWAAEFFGPDERQERPRAPRRRSSGSRSGGSKDDQPPRGEKPPT
jgi:D-glycero-D-manno-heptose 1,7-bisphosphate phosphatase